VLCDASQDRDERLKQLSEPPFPLHSFGVQQFADLLCKRLFLLREIDSAYTRQQAEESEAVYHVQPSKKQLPKVAEVGIRSGVRLVISLLRSQSRLDPELREVRMSCAHWRTPARSECAHHVSNVCLVHPLPVCVVPVVCVLCVCACDADAVQEALDFFLEILSELPPLGLWGDGSMSLLLDKSFTSVARFLDEIVSAGDDVRCVG